jgi:molybdate transport system substrate-binding protein
MRRRALPIAVAILLSACGGAGHPPGSPTPTSPAISGRITILAAASLTDAFTKAADQLRARRPGTEFALSFGSSSTLATQITNGAPADVFASADEPNMQKVVDAGLATTAPSIFAGNRLAIAVAPGNPKHVTGLADLARPGLIVVLAAPTVPAGKYALDALAKAGTGVRPASLEVDVRAVLNKIALGEADAGIVYVTDVKSAGSRVSGVDIPEGQQVVARYPIAVLKATTNAALATAFVDYILAEDGQKLLAELGFSRP